MIGRRVGLLAAAAGLVLALGLSVFPVRAWLAQGHYHDQLVDQAEAAAAANLRLEQRAQQLGTDTEIERIARASHNLVRPGEEAYVILPDNTPVPEPTPAEPVKPESKGWVSRTWSKVTSLF